jgi:hypothetical protein
MRDWARRIDELLFPSVGNSDAQQLQAGLLAIQEDTSKSETERRVEVDARLGQGKFRAALISCREKRSWPGLSRVDCRRRERSD